MAIGHSGCYLHVRMTRCWQLCQKLGSKGREARTTYPAFLKGTKAPETGMRPMISICLSDYSLVVAGEGEAKE